MNKQFGKNRREFIKNGILSSAGVWSLLQTGTSKSKALGEEKPKLNINPDPEILFERVEKIISDGRWNGRPEVVLWKARYWLTFVSSAGHLSADSKIVMLSSEGDAPRKWTNRTTLLETELCDAESHLLTTPERLFAYLVQEHPGKFMPVGTLVTYTDDGVHWTGPQRVYEPLWSFWKPKTLKGVHYVAADIMEGRPRLELLKSTDGLNWEKVSRILEGNYTETALVFLPDDSLLAITRQGPGPSISHSYPPYTEWKVYDGPEMGGPEAALVGNTILACSRGSRYREPDDQLLGLDPFESRRRTVLWTFDMDQMRLKWKMNMPTQYGGDQSYAHFLVLDEHRVLMVWYDGEAYEKGMPNRADIFLAVLRIQ